VFSKEGTCLQHSRTPLITGKDSISRDEQTLAFTSAVWARVFSFVLLCNQQVTSLVLAPTICS